MAPAHFPKHDSDWLRGLVDKDAAPAAPLLPEDAVEANMPTSLRAAQRVAKHVVAPRQTRSSNAVWAAVKRWLRARRSRALSRYLAPQREFNLATINTLVSHIRATERRLLTLEAQYQMLAKEVSLLRARVNEPR